MKPSRRFAFTALAAIGALALAVAIPAGAQAPTNQEAVAALKANLTMSRTLLKQYEWIEFTVLSLKGEEKSRTEYRCYWGADGKMQRVPIGATPSTDKKRGLRGKIAENKAKEIAEYMKSALELVKSYVPPDPDRIEALKSAGKVSFTPAGSRMGIAFADYQKPGDNLGVTLDLAKNTLLDLTVDTWLKDAKDVVGMKATFGTLTDGATYAAEITLSAPSQELVVKMTNSGYKKQ
jgi:hypothetical protein